MSITSMHGIPIYIPVSIPVAVPGAPLSGWLGFAVSPKGSDLAWIHDTQPPPICLRRGRTTFLKACAEGDGILLHTFLHEGADINYQVQPPFSVFALPTDP